jgi:formylmethanofuran dehydrogenase subunit E
MLDTDTVREAGLATRSFDSLLEAVRFCATDAIQALTGVNLGKRTLKHLDYGKMAATFANVRSGHAVRVAAREAARERACEWGHRGA